MHNPPIKEDFPEWVEIPKRYLELLKYEQDEFLPWYLFDRENLLYRYKGLQTRYQNRRLFPFARHDYCDDVACWEKDKPGKVIIVHDYASPGWEQKFESPSFEGWYEYILSQKE